MTRSHAIDLIVLGVVSGVISTVCIYLGKAWWPASVDAFVVLDLSLTAILSFVIVLLATIETRNKKITVSKSAKADGFFGHPYVVIAGSAFFLCIVSNAFVARAQRLADETDLILTLGKCGFQFLTLLMAASLGISLYRGYYRFVHGESPQ